jgi:hypothetical protein
MCRGACLTCGDIPTKMISYDDLLDPLGLSLKAFNIKFENKKKNLKQLLNNNSYSDCRMFRFNY